MDGWIVGWMIIRGCMDGWMDTWTETDEREVAEKLKIMR